MRNAAGNAFSIARRVPYGPPVSISEKGDARKALGRRLMSQSNLGHEGMVLNRDVVRAAGTSDAAIVERSGDGVDLRSAADVRGKSWNARVTEHSMRWVEAEVDLDAQIIWPGLQWYLIDRNESTFYAS